MELKFASGAIVAFLGLLSLTDAQAAENVRVRGTIVSLDGSTLTVKTREGSDAALALKPDLFEAYGNLAQAFLASGQAGRASEAACRALELNETPQTRALFAQCVAAGRLGGNASRYRRWLARALVEGWTRPRELTRAAMTLIKRSATIADAIAREGERRDIWNEITRADLMFLTSDKPAQIGRAYGKALADANPFCVDAARRNILLFRDLGLLPENVKAALDQMRQAAPEKVPPPARVVLFTGHMLDALGRAPDKSRFPPTPEAEKKAREMIEDDSCAGT